MVEGNFDSVILDDELQIYVIADGIATQPGAEKASRIVTESIIDYYQYIDFSILSEEDVLKIIKDSIIAANSAIQNFIRENPKFTGMGSTLVYCVVIGEHVFVCNVGNSRVYLVTENTTILLTKDHTVFQLLHENKIGPLQVLEEVNGDRVLTQYIGQADFPTPYLSSSHFPKGYYLVICTDGLTNLITPEEIHDVVMNGFGGLQQKCDFLVHMAIKHGGFDNITISLVHHS